MPVYQYKAKNLNGITIEGKLKAEDEKNAMQVIRSIGYYPFYIKKCNRRNVFLSSNKMSNKELALICRQLALFNGAGINIIQTFEIIKNNISFVYKDYFEEVVENIKKGMNLSSALCIDNVIPEILIKMIGVGENSGKLDETLQSMAEYFEWKQRFEKKIKQVLIYPFFVAITAFIVINILIFKVVPSFIKLFNQFNIIDLPFSTRLLFNISNFVKYNSLVIIIPFLIFLVTIKYILDNEKIAIILNSIKLKIPVYRNVEWLNFIRAFSMLISSGIPITESIDICIETIENVLIKKSLKNALNKIKEGSNISDAFALEKIIPATIVNIIKTGEESGNLDIMLKKCFDIYEVEVENSSMRMVSIIEPIMIIFLSLIVGFIVLSVVMPVFQMYEFIGQW